MAKAVFVLEYDAPEDQEYMTGLMHEAVEKIRLITPLPTNLYVAIREDAEKVLEVFK